MTALHVFDMDGTLLRGTTASKQIAAQHGSSAELLILERRFAAQEIDTRQFAREIHALWQGLDPATVHSAFHRRRLDDRHRRRLRRHSRKGRKVRRHHHVARLLRPPIT